MTNSSCDCCDSFAGRRSDPLSLNLYTYCRNNPLRYVDPSGHITVNSQWDWAYYVAKGNINYEYDGGNGDVAQRAQNILTYSRASAAERVKMKKNNQSNPTKISDKGAELLISLEVGVIEGDKIMTKDLGDGGITIGFGTFIEHGDDELRRYYEKEYNITIKEGEYLSRETAMKIYKDSLSDYEGVVSHFAENNGVALTQNQFDALTMQAYNRPSDSYLTPYLNDELSDEALVNQIMGVYQENTTDEYYSKYGEGWRNRVSKQVDLYRYGRYE